MNSQTNKNNKTKRQQKLIIKLFVTRFDFLKINLKFKKKNQLQIYTLKHMKNKKKTIDSYYYKFYINVECKLWMTFLILLIIFVNKFKLREEKVCEMSKNMKKKGEPLDRFTCCNRFEWIVLVQWTKQENGD